MTEERLVSKRILMVISPDNFRDEEFSYPKLMLEEEGARITIASTTTRESRGMLGLKVSPHMPLRAVRIEDYDAVIVVGGTGAKEYLWDDEDLHNILRTADEKGKLIAAICLACVTLAKAGILKGKKATVFKTETSLFELESGGAEYIQKPLVTDGTIITADGPRSAKNFASAILKALSEHTGE